MGLCLYILPYLQTRRADFGIWKVLLKSELIQLNNIGQILKSEYSICDIDCQ